MKYSRYFLMIVLIKVSIFALAQNPSSSPVQEYREEGQLLSVRLVVSEPIRIFVVGKEEAKIDLSDLKLTVRRLKPYPAREFTASRKGDYFEVSEPKDLSRATNLEVKAETRGRVETLNFKLNTLP